MRKLITLAALLALALPAAALADEGGRKNENTPAAESQAESQQPTASQACKAQRTQLGIAAFKLLHGTPVMRTNALGKCVAKYAALKRLAVANAVKTCKAEKAMSDDEFKAAGHDNKTFNEVYGSGKNGKNAFGKCVSQQAKENAAAAVEAVINAAKTCKTEKKMAAAAFAKTHGGKTFAQHYGTNTRLTNAYGKCVAAAVKQAASTQTQTT